MPHRRCGALVGRASLFTLRHVPFVEFFKAIFYVHAFAYICNSRTKFAAIDSLANGPAVYFCFGTCIPTLFCIAPKKLNYYISFSGTTCHLDNSWSGKWFEYGERDAIHIDAQNITHKGTCNRRKHDKYIFKDP